MRKIIRGKLFGHDLYFRIGKRIKVDGVNSTLTDDDSVLFWEFDNLPYHEVYQALKIAQIEHCLSSIIIMQASVETSWHAVCWERQPWPFALGIVAMTERVDPDYIRLAASRGHFTLRMTDKGQGAPKYYATLNSDWPGNVSPNDLKTAVSYNAWVKG